MSVLPKYTFQRGEPITYALRVKSGDPTGYVLTSKLKPIGPGDTGAPNNAVPSVADFNVVFVAAALDVTAHWLLSISASQSASLTGNRFIADEKLTFNGVVVKITDPVIIIIDNSVSL